ncbi:hypothetical protein T492DRAFT_1099056 [Pavlovales sp. CCMP2436]|nr:hypothetical protein T492DRAFT_1099056 [Pavlovales sp. CCMP2436]
MATAPEPTGPAAPSPGEAEKAAGNAHFKGGDFLKAAACYTKAIKADPANHVLYSNRAQAFLKLNKVTNALKDADKCIELAPAFVKGYHRRALALVALERKPEAYEATLTAVELDLSSKELVKLGIELRGKEFAAAVAAMRRAKADAENPPALADEKPAPPLAQKEAKSAPEKAAASEAAAPVERQRPSKALVDLTPEEFASEIVRTCLSDLMEKRPLEPRIFMQPKPPKTRKEAKNGEAPAMGVMQISMAFDSPETVKQAIPAVRNQVNEVFKAQAAALAVLKSSIAFPRTWTKSSWKFPDDCEGIFMQLEHPIGRGMWFTHIEDVATCKVGETISLDPEEFGVLPQLFPGANHRF